MKNWILIFVMAAVCSFVSSCAQPAHVIITAGQSNTDGRASNLDLPAYIKALSMDTIHYATGAYPYCRIAQNDPEGRFIPFWPQAKRGGETNKFGFDAVAYYWLGQLWKEEFYVIKWAIGGTAISPQGTPGKPRCWYADSTWLAQNKATSEGGPSLLLSFVKEIDVCIDQTLSKLEQGYQIDAFLWHQGESDHLCGKDYYQNLKTLVAYVRAHLSAKTGKDYSQLPFIFGTVAHGNVCYSAEVEEAMQRLASEDPNMYLIDLSAAELLPDRLHFTARSAEHFGREVYQTIASFQR